MNDPFLVIDEFLVDKCERFSKRTQSLIGLGATGWSQIFLAVTIILILEDIHGNFSFKFMRWFLVIDSVLRFLLAAKKRSKVGSERTANSLKTNHHPYFRTIAMMLALITIIDLCWFQWSIAAAYFEACDEDEPTESKAKQWLKHLMRVGRLRPVTI